MFSSLANLASKLVPPSWKGSSDDAPASENKNEKVPVLQESMVDDLTQHDSDSNSTGGEEKEQHLQQQVSLLDGVCSAQEKAFERTDQQDYKANAGNDSAQDICWAAVETACKKAQKQQSSWSMMIEDQQRTTTEIPHEQDEPASTSDSSCNDTVQAANECRVQQPDQDKEDSSLHDGVSFASEDTKRQSESVPTRNSDVCSDKYQAANECHQPLAGQEEEDFSNDDGDSQCAPIVENNGHVCSTTTEMGVEQKVQNEVESMHGAASFSQKQMQAAGGSGQCKVPSEKEREYSNEDAGVSSIDDSEGCIVDQVQKKLESISGSKSSCKAKMHADGGEQEEEQIFSNDDGDSASTSDNGQQCTETVIEQLQHDLGSVSISKSSCKDENGEAPSAHLDEKEIAAGDNDQCAASMAMAEQQVDSECSSCADEDLVATGGHGYDGCVSDSKQEEQGAATALHRLLLNEQHQQRNVSDGISVLQDETQVAESALEQLPRNNNNHQQLDVSSGHSSSGDDQAARVSSLEDLFQMEHRGGHEVPHGHCPEESKAQAADEMVPEHVQEMPKPGNSSPCIGNLALIGAAIEQTQENSNESVEPVQVPTEQSRAVTPHEQRPTDATSNTSRPPQGNLDLLADISSAIHGLCPTAQDLQNALQEDIADYHTRKGLELNEAGSYTEAIIELEKALEILCLNEPKSMKEAACLFDIGCALMHKGDRDEALRMFRESLKIQCRLAPSSFEAAKSNVKVGFLLAEKGDLFDALFHFREAYALFSGLNCHTMDMATLCIHTGTVLFNQGDFDGSLKSYHEALPIVARLKPESFSEAGLYKKIGTALYEQGDYEEALRNFRRAMAIYEKIEPPTSLQLEKLRVLINFLSADGSNSGKKNTEKPTVSPPLLADTSAAVPFDGPSSEQHPSSTPETPQLDTRKSRRKRLLPAKFSGDVFVLDQETTFLQGREEVDIAESANDNRTRPCSLGASTDSSWGTLLHVSKKQRSVALSSSRDNSPVSASAAWSTPRVAQPKWTAEEDKLLLEKRALGLDWRQIAEHLPGRNVNGCKARVTYLGRRKPMIKSSRAPWTEQEDAILMEKHALGLDWKQIADHLPQRNEGGCRARYNALKASSRGEKTAVSRGDDELVAVKTAGNATSRIKIRPPWTEQEDAILIEKYGLGLDWSQIAEHLPKRNEGGCKRRSDVLGLTSQKKDVPGSSQKEDVPGFRDDRTIRLPWTKQEDSILIQKHKLGLDWEQTAEHLNGRTANGCKRRGIRLGLTSQKEDVPGSRDVPRAIRLPWTKDEDSILIEKHKLGMDWEQIAEHLKGRTADGCKSRGKRLRLKSQKGSALGSSAYYGKDVPFIKRNATSQPWTKEEDVILREKHSLGLNWDQTAKHLAGRNAMECSKRGSSLGLIKLRRGDASSATVNKATAVSQDSSAVPVSPVTPKSVASFKPTAAREKWQQLEIGARVEVYCPVDSIYLAATVTGRRSPDESVFTICYDNGEVERIDLCIEPFRLLEAAVSASRDATAGRKKTFSASPNATAGKTKTQGVFVPRDVTAGKTKINKWTEEEDALLREKQAVVPALSWKEIACFFPGRTEGGVSGRASKLGICNGKQRRSSYGGQSKRKATATAPALRRNAGVKRKMNGSSHPWTREEDSILRSKRALGRLSWEETAAFLPGRSPDECCSRFESLSRQSKSVVAGPSSSLGAASKRQKTAPTKQTAEVANVMTVFGSEVETWTSEEDKILQRKRAQGLTWPQIARSFKGRSSSACSNRYAKMCSRRKTNPGYRRGLPDWYSNPSSKDSSVTKGDWTPEEDAVILRKRASHTAFDRIAESLPGRTARECQQRYRDVLKAQKDLPRKEGIPKVHWTLVEDEILRQKRSRHADWDSIAACLPGRTANACRQRYSDAQFSRRKKGSSRPRWTEEDIRLVKESYLISFPRMVANALP